MEYFVAILAGGGFTFIVKMVETYFARKDKKQDDKKQFGTIINKLESIERDGKRTQLLLLISDYPDRTDEIMEVAHKYFIELNGDWYAHDIFDKWLLEKNYNKPSWYK